MTAQVLLALAMSVGAPAAKDKPKGDIDIVGEWLLISTTSKGETEEFTNKERTIFTFAADGKMTMRHGSQRHELQFYPYIFDPQVQPAALDIDLDPDKEERETHVLVAIVKVEGDTLTLCHRMHGPRPKNLEGSKAAAQVLLVFQRLKAE